MNYMKEVNHCVNKICKSTVFYGMVLKMMGCRAQRINFCVNQGTTCLICISFAVFSAAPQRDKLIGKLNGGWPPWKGEQLQKKPSKEALHVL